MNQDDLDRRWAHDLAHAEMTLLKDGEVHPFFVVIGRGGATYPILANFDSPDLKEMTYAMVRCACIAHDAALVISRGEVWMVVGTDLPEGVSPSRSDRRIEAVVVTAAARLGEGDGEVIFRSSLREILRGPDGKATGLRDVVLPEGDEEAEHQGAIVDLLLAERPSPAERRKARDVLERAMKRMGRGKPPFVQ